MKFRLLLFLLLLISFSTEGVGQFRISSEAGSMSYVGDLTPLQSSLSFGNSKPYFGLALGYEFSSVVTGFSKYTYGSIEGNDADAQEEARRLRNLSFTSTIHEIGLGVEVDLNELFFPFLDKYGINLFYSTGLNYFSFNPRTFYKGEWVELQPLNTECQSCTEVSETSPYSRKQINIPYGLGFDFFLSKKIKMGFVWTQRWAFTDYLDDVSNKYADPDLLSQRFGPISAELSDRSGELPNVTISNAVGSQRGNPDNDDGYFTLGIRFTVLLSAKDKLDTSIEEQENKIILEESQL